MSAIFCAFWYELIYFSFRPLSDVVSAYFLLAAFACLTCKTHKGAAWLFGICNALALAIRLQLLPATIYLLALSFITFERRQLLRSLAAFGGIVALAGLLDYLTWGQWFASYYNTYLFQWIFGASNMWGTQDASFFLVALMQTSFGLLPVALIFGSIYVKRLWPLIGLLIVLIAVHSLIPHKEYRFIFAVVPILLIVTAAVCDLLLELLSPEPDNRGWQTRLAVPVFLAISIVGILNGLPGEACVYQFRPLFKRQEDKLAFLYLSKQADITGLNVHSSACMWWGSGGYYYLHQNVPIYFTTHRSDQLKIAQWISHLLCAKSDRFWPDFECLSKFADLRILRHVYRDFLTGGEGQRPMPPQYKMDILQPGIDGTYLPTVRPFLR